MLIAVVACWLALPSGVIDVGDGAEWYGKTISEVRVVGGDEDAAAGARAVLGIKPGDALDVQKNRVAIRRVFLTGPWADVRIAAEDDAAGGVRLLVTLVPDVLVRDLVFRAPRDLPAERLRDAAGVAVGDRFREDGVEAARLRVLRALSDLGFPRGEVRVDVANIDDAGRKLTFLIEAGAPVTLRSVALRGDGRLARDEVLHMLGVEEGKPFDRLHAEQGLEQVRLRLLHMRHFGARAEIASLTTDEAKESAALVLRVEAGPRYHVRFVGNALLPDAELRLVVNDGTIESLEPTALLRQKNQLEAHYREAGYALVAVTVDDTPAAPPLSRDAEREVRFRIVEGARAEVTAVHIDGADPQRERELVDDVWATVNAETPDPGLLQTVDGGDLDALLSIGAGKARPPGPFEVADQGVELLPRPFIGRKPVYLENVFVEAGRRLADRYRSDGFLDVQVKGPAATFSPDGREVSVRYTIREGPRVAVSAVRFVDADDDGAHVEGLPLADMTEGVALLPGSPASFAAITDARAAVERNLQRHGYPFATVSEAIQRSPADPSAADVVFAVDTGVKVTIGKVRVKGNNVTQDLVILDRVTLAPGDQYDVSEVEQSQKRLARLGLFSSVSVELLDDDPNATVRDLLVVVRERPQFAVEVGAGASIEDGPRAFLAGEVRNIFGLGLGVRGRGQLNYPRAFYDFLYDKDDPNNPLLRFPPEENIAVDFLRFFEGQAVIGGELPKVYGVPFDTRLHVDALAQREIRPAFTLNKASVLAGVDAQPATWLHVGPQIEGEISDFDCPKDLRFGQSCGEGSIGLVRRRDAGFLRQVTYRMQLSSDLRDNPVRPRAGVLLSGVTDVALGSGTLRTSGEQVAPVDVSSDFVKVTGAVVGYVPLSQSFVWALSLRAGNIFPFSNSYIPLFKRFYLGGTGSVRGFREDQILPADDAGFPATSGRPLDGNPADGRQSLGGNFFVNGRSELRVALVGDLEIGAFVDVGELLEEASAFTPDGFAAGAGIGLRYNTPVGPFAVDLGWQVLDGHRLLPSFQSLDRLNLHLSIGYF